MRRAFLVAFALSLGFVSQGWAKITYSGPTGTIGDYNSILNTGMPATGPHVDLPAVQATSNDVNWQSPLGPATAHYDFALNLAGFTFDGSSSAPVGLSNWGYNLLSFSFAVDQPSTLHFDSTSNTTIAVIQLSNSAFLWQATGTSTKDLSLAVGQTYLLQELSLGKNPSNFTVAASIVPEPATWLLALIGIACATGARRWN